MDKDHRRENSRRREPREMSLAVAWARSVGAGCRSDWLLYRRIQDFIHGRMVKQKKSLN